MEVQSYSTTGPNDNIDQSTNKEALFENKLTLAIKTLQTLIDSTMQNLTATGEDDGFAVEIVHLINKIEVLHLHFELVLAVINSNSEEEVQAAKEKYKLIKSGYEKVKSKDDITCVTMQFLLDFFQTRTFVEIRRILSGLFKISPGGEVHLLKTEENLAKVKILAGKIEVAIEYCPSVSTYPKDDLFSYDRSSPVWQDLLSHATFKQFITKHEIKESFKPFHLLLHVARAVLRKELQGGTGPSPRTAFHFLRDIAYYGTQYAKAETEALLYLTEPSIDHVFKAWNIGEHPFFATALGLRYPKMSFDDRIYVPRLFPRITKELVLQEYQEGTINKIIPIDSSQLTALDVPSMSPQVLEELFIENEDRVPIRIISSEKLKFSKTKAGKAIINPESKVVNDHSIIIHIHGGGFVSMSSFGHRCYLTRWAKDLKVVIFSIDYRLAPKNPYPDAVDDVWQAYLWIINYAEKLLGIKTPKVILAGDSAGGNLVTALTLRLIKAGLQPPLGCYIIYPALLLDEGNCTPSYFNALEDPVLHYNILRLCQKAYIEPEFKPLEDPFLSPVIASDELLAKLPPVRIVTGSEDPLHDDSWRIFARLRNLNKDVKIIVHQDLAHAWMGHPDLKNYKLFMKEGCEIFRELMSLDTTSTS